MVLTINLTASDQTDVEPKALQPKQQSNNARPMLIDMESPGMRQRIDNLLRKVLPHAKESPRNRPAVHLQQIQCKRVRRINDTCIPKPHIPKQNSSDPARSLRPQRLSPLDI